MGKRKLRSLRQRTFENVLYMLESRGFDLRKGSFIEMHRNKPTIVLSDFTEYLGMTLDEFDETFPDDEDLMILSGIFENPRTGNRLLTYFNEDEKINKDFVRRLASFAEVLHCDEIILVYRSTFTPDARKEFDPKKNQMAWEAISYNQVSTNLNRSPFSPEYQRVSPDQKDAILNRLAINEQRRLPHMEDSDIVAIWYGFQIGDLIQVTRRDAGLGGAAPNEIAYRIVVPERTKSKKATAKVQGVKIEVEETGEEKESQEDLDAAIAAEFGAEF